MDRFFGWQMFSVSSESWITIAHQNTAFAGVCLFQPFI